MNLFKTAISHHRSGRLQQALDIYYQVLKSRPKDPVALHLFGVVACQVGREKIGIPMIKKAIKIKPDYARAYSDLGNIYLHQTNLIKALFNYRKAILIDPNLAEAHNNLGNVYKEQGYLELAYDSYRRAIEINPDYTDAHSNMLLVMNYLPELSGEIYSESLKWGIYAQD